MCHIPCYTHPITHVPIFSPIPQTVCSCQTIPDSPLPSSRCSSWRMLPTELISSFSFLRNFPNIPLKLYFLFFASSDGISMLILVLLVVVPEGMFITLIVSVGNDDEDTFLLLTAIDLDRVWVIWFALLTECRPPPRRNTSHWVRMSFLLRQ